MDRLVKVNQDRWLGQISLAFLEALSMLVRGPRGFNTRKGRAP